MRKSRAHYIDRGIPRGDTVPQKKDYTRYIQQLYVALYGPQAGPDLEQRLRGYISEDLLTQEFYDVIMPVLKAHLIKEEWESFVRQPILPPTELRQDDFFWSDYYIMMYHGIRKAQVACEGVTLSDRDASPTVRMLRYLRTFDVDYAALQESNKPFVVFYAGIGFIARIFEAIEKKYSLETGQGMSGQDFYAAATDPEISQLLLGVMYNDQPSGKALIHECCQYPNDIERIDNPMNLDCFVRDSETNAVRFSHEYIEHIQSMITSGAIPRAEKQVSCPVAHIRLINDIVQHMAAVAAYYRFGGPALPPHIQMMPDSEEGGTLHTLMQSQYHVLMSPEYKAARGIIP